MKKILLIFVGCLSCWLQATAAVRVKSLYQASVPVLSQQVDARQRAFSVAFTEVLVRASGNLAIAQQSEIRKHLLDAESFVDDFHYEKRFTEPDFPWVLIINFDSASINRLLRETHATVWGENRPLILFWLVNELSNQAPKMITLGDDEGVAAALKQQADRRGLPIIFPLIDLSELERVSLADVNSANFSILLPAAKRYGCDAVLAGRLFHNDSGYHFAATINLPDEKFIWDVVEPTLPDLLVHFTDRLANLLATHYASVMTEQTQSELKITVIGIRENADIDKLLRNLSDLAPVANIRIVQVNGASVVLDLSLRGTLSAFNEAISVDQHLERVENETQSTDNTVWQWKE